MTKLKLQATDEADENTVENDTSIASSAAVPVVEDLVLSGSTYILDAVRSSRLNR